MEDVLSTNVKRSRKRANMEDSHVVGRPLAFSCEEQRAFHSWSRISSAGHNVLLDALKIFDPKSCDLSDSEELLTFLQDLCMEGHKPTVLRSKDVYGYRSCTSQPLTKDMLKPPNRNKKSMAKKRAKRSSTKKKEVHPSWNSSERSSPRIYGVRPPELLWDHYAMFSSQTSIHTVELEKVRRLQPCLRLTNIKGLSGCHTARLQIHTSWDSETPTVVSVEQQQPPALSGIPLQPSQNGGVAPTKAVALLSQKSQSCPLRSDGALIGDSAPVFYTYGRGFPGAQTQLTCHSWKSHSHQHGGQGPKEMNGLTRHNCKDKNCIRWKVIKVDDSRSVAEALRKAEKILQVNLSPVIQIESLNCILENLRYQKK
ncbi:uncharacterized protein ccdc71 isoform X1 [Takifugu rubripes]|uniref:Coiled-coil domain containing 71 n=2 Tax=Takifugu rubripes TaxID=31033 RepID=A0A674NR42_TAKRU|nr:uncharacterized protein LOC101073323 isoform X1 [Takifugu rubripes]